MTVIWDRRNPRTRTTLPVTVALAGSTDAIASGTVADMSPGGIRVDTDAPLPVGREVVCRMPRGTGTIELPGEVAWSESEGDTPGMGVRWGQMPEDAAQHIAGLTGGSREHGESVRVAFEGLPSPIKARAWVSGEGIRLTTALPFIRLGSSLEIAMPGGQPVPGQVERVSLRYPVGETVPVLDIEIGVGGDQVIAQPTPASAAAVVELPETAPTWVEPATDSTEKIRESWRPGLWAGLLVLGAAGLVGLTYGLSRMAKASPAPVAINQPIATAEVPSPPPIANPVTAEPMQVTQPVPAAAAQPTPISPEITTPRQVLVPAADTAPAPTKTPVPTPSEAPVVAAKPVQIKIPIKGSTKGLRHYPLANPNGVAVNLPNATTSLKPGVHGLDDDKAPAKKLWVRRLDSGLQIRVLWAESGVRYQVTANESHLIVRTQP